MSVFLQGDITIIFDRLYTPEATMFKSRFILQLFMWKDINIDVKFRSFFFLFSLYYYPR
jgi:hypothetical protein